MDRQEYAKQIRSRGYSCSQTVLAASEDMHGKLDEQTLLALGGGLGGGARRGEICGAVSGALIALGLIYPHNIDGDDEAKREIARKTREFTGKFKERYGELACSRLLGVDMSRPEGMQEAAQKGTSKRCGMYIEGALEILEEMFEGDKDK